MQAVVPLTRDVVFVGGGHTHALVLRKWGMNPLPGARLTLISPTPTVTYSGMLPGHIAGHYSRDEIEIDLVRLARFAGARLILGPATGLNRETKHISVKGHADVSYDIASFDVGISSDMPKVPGFAQFAQGIKPVDQFLAAWDAFIVRAQSLDRPAKVAIVGGGVGGVEAAMAMKYRLVQAGRDDAEVCVYEAGDRVLSQTGSRARKSLLGHLDRLGVSVVCSAAVSEFTEAGIVTNEGLSYSADFVAVAAGATPHAWLAETELPLEEGFIAVDESLCCTTVGSVYAVGDCAHLTFNPRPKAGVFAVREAPVLFDNICADLTSKSRRAFKPQRDYLKLISTGGKTAVADKFGLRAGGAWLWRVKDRIDVAFMRKLEVLPEMDLPKLPARVASGVAEAFDNGKPQCGGCGSKVGQTSLREALGALPATHRSDVISAPGDDAAILRHGKQKQVITTDHLRAFTLDPWSHSRIAAIHALGDIWAMGAEPQVALASIVLPRTSTKLQTETLREIMDAAGAVFAGVGAEVVGGHTSVGDELSIGFTVTGLSAKNVISLAGAQAGDKLILTKPIGTGVLLAAEMQKLAKGDWVAKTFESMGQSQAEAAKLLAEYAHAMTDVTGFGLARHLSGMLEVSEKAAVLAWNDVPLLDGAAKLSKGGVRSTLWPENAALLSAMEVSPECDVDLLFDPQTAGGLLAAIPAAEADSLLTALRPYHPDAAIIGEICEGLPAIKVVSTLTP